MRYRILDVTLERKFKENVVALVAQRRNWWGNWIDIEKPLTAEVPTRRPSYYGDYQNREAYKRHEELYRDWSHSAEKARWLKTLEDQCAASILRHASLGAGVIKEYSFTRESLEAELREQRLKDVAA